MLKNKKAQHIYSILGIFIFSFIAFGSLGDDAPDMSDWTEEQKKEYKINEQIKKAKADSLKYENWMISEAFHYSKDQMKKRLKSPSTAEFPETGAFADYQDDKFVSKISDGKYKVKCWVDSQNGFGAMIRTDWSCVITFDKGWVPLGSKEDNEGKFYRTSFY